MISPAGSSSEIWLVEIINVTGAENEIQNDESVRTIL
jgi:hypothetical protein